MLPDLRIRFGVEIREAPVGGFLGPLEDPLEFVRLGRGEQAVGLLHGLAQPPGAEIILPSLEHRKGEPHRQNPLRIGRSFSVSVPAN